MSFLTCFWLFPQKEHLSRSLPSPIRGTRVLLPVEPERCSIICQCLAPGQVARARATRSVPGWCSRRYPAGSESAPYYTRPRGARAGLSAVGGQTTSVCLSSPRQPTPRDLTGKLARSVPYPPRHRALRMRRGRPGLMTPVFAGNFAAAIRGTHQEPRAARAGGSGLHREVRANGSSGLQ